MVFLAGCTSEWGRLELWNRQLDPILVVIADRQYSVEGCGHLRLDGVRLTGIELARPDGSVYAAFDVGGLEQPLAGARYIIEQSTGDAIDLRVPPADLPECRGHIGPPLHGLRDPVAASLNLRPV